MNIEKELGIGSPQSGRDLLLETIREELRAKLGLRDPPPGYVPWRKIARPNQLAPSWEWFVWMLLAGRGFGKTRSGGGWVHERAMAGDERRWIALVGKTPGDVRDDMLNSPGGLLTNAPSHEKPEYYPSRRELVWPTGAHATIYSGANPEQIRGFSGDTAWVDELAAYDYPQATWDNLMFGMREKTLAEPQVVVTTTPKPIPLIKELVKAEGDYVHVTRGSSYENRENLSDRYYSVVIKPYEGTKLGRQEIYADILEDVEGALWSHEVIDRKRMRPGQVPDLDLIAISVDPAVTATEDSDETGILALGRGLCKCNGSPEYHGFVLDDQSGVYKAERWGSLALEMYDEWEADFIMGEVNNGGDLVARNVRAIRRDFKFKNVRASRGKHRRAEPVASLYGAQKEGGKVHHVGEFPLLEEQMTTWVPGVGMPSPDRMDTLVHGFTKLLLERLYLLSSDDLDEWNEFRPAG